LRIERAGGLPSDVARKIEIYCGFAPGSVLQVHGETLTIRGPSNVNYDQLTKLFAVLDVVMPRRSLALIAEVTR
jgi:hypothetical protein